MQAQNRNRILVQMSKKIRRLAKLSDAIVDVKMPLSKEAIAERNENYYKLPPGSFSKLFKDVWMEPVDFTYNGTSHQLQMNFCSNPFCKWYGMPQERFTTVPNKPHRYKIGSSEKYILCEP